MKIKVGRYELEIAAIKDGVEDNKELLYFLNDVSLMANYAAEHLETKGYEVRPAGYREISKTLYQICKKEGAYD